MKQHVHNAGSRFIASERGAFIIPVKIPGLPRPRLKNEKEFLEKEAEQLRREATKGK